MFRELRLIGLLVLGTLLVQDSVAATDELLRDHLLAQISSVEPERIPIIVRYNNVQSTGASLSAAQAGHVSARLQQAQSKLKQNILTKKAHALTSVQDFKYVPMSAMQVNREALETLLSDPSLTVYEDSVRRPLLTQSVARVYSSRNSSVFHGNNQWAVAVLDSGVNKTHPNLSNKVISEACYSGGNGIQGLSSLCPGGAASSVAINSGAACSIAGCEHGSMVAGIAAGNGATQDGVARDARLISIQIFSELDDKDQCPPPDESACLVALTSDVIKGLERVYALRNSVDIAAVNLSLGSSEVFSGTCDNQPERPIIDLLKEANIAVVAASGNRGLTSMMSAPACISSAIAVAATFDDSDIPWPSNNRSLAIDLFAPGVSISAPGLGSSFNVGTGTSLAAPHVAGALAVMRHADPSLSVNQALGLLKNHGPVVEQNAISRRRLDVTSILTILAPWQIVPSTVIAPIIMLLLE